MKLAIKRAAKAEHWTNKVLSTTVMAAPEEAPAVADAEADAETEAEAEAAELWAEAAELETAEAEEAAEAMALEAPLRTAEADFWSAEEILLKADSAEAKCVGLAGELSEAEMDLILLLLQTNKKTS